MGWRHEDREFLLDAYGSSDMSTQRPEGELSGSAVDAMIDSWQSGVESASRTRWRFSGGVNRVPDRGGRVGHRRERATRESL